MLLVHMILEFYPQTGSSGWTSGVIYIFCLFSLCRRTHKSNFIEVISISDSPVQSRDVPYIAQSSRNVVKDISISLDGPVKTSEVSNVEKSCSHSNSEEYFDNLNESKGDDDICSVNDKCFDDSYEIQQEPDRLTPLLVNSHEVDGDDESNLSRESTSPKSR